jgi:hypothetical protein
MTKQIYAVSDDDLIIIQQKRHGSYRDRAISFRDLRQNLLRVRVVAGTSHTLEDVDNGATLVFTSDSDITLTVPIELDDNFQCVVVQAGDGDIIPTAAATVSVTNYEDHTKTAGQGSVAALIATDVNTFVFSGATAE